MNISVTERDVYKRCPRQWYFAFKMNIASIKPKPHFDLGTLVHNVLARWALDTEHSTEYHLKTEAINLIQDVKTYYEKINKSVDLDYLYEIIDEGLGLVTQYEKYYETPLPERWSIVAVEMQFEIPVGSNILTGKVDKICKDENGLLYVLDHKTYSRPPSEYDIRMNNQFLAYRWILEQINIGPVGGFLYDGIEKAIHTERSRRPLSEFFMRKLVKHPRPQIEEFGTHIQYELEDIARPRETYTFFRPWKNCGDCEYDTLCAAISLGEDYEYVRESKFGPRRKK